VKAIWQAVLRRLGTTADAQGRRRASGVTLIELMTAMTVSAIVIGVIFHSWNVINRHVAVHQRRGIFVTDVRRIATTLSSQIRRSPQVLAWHSAGITFLKPPAGDTVSYEFNGSELLLNDQPVPLVAYTARITEFSLEEEVMDIPNGQFTVLLHLRMRAEDDFNDTTSVALDIAISKPTEEQDSEEKDDWNFR
jgi:prepilin-type N-terminal cleavage/methylation domain-containing protein